MQACGLKWVGRDWSISADYIWLNYSGANISVHHCVRDLLGDAPERLLHVDGAVVKTGHGEHVRRQV